MGHECCEVDEHRPDCPQNYYNWPETKAAQLLERQKVLCTTTVYVVLPQDLQAVQEALALLKKEILVSNHFSGCLGEFTHLHVRR